MGTRIITNDFVGDSGLGFDPLVRRGLQYLNFLAVPLIKPVETWPREAQRQRSLALLLFKLMGSNLRRRGRCWTPEFYSLSILHFSLYLIAQLSRRFSC
ncbi:Uncharacterised protein [Klebsiella pneumoniae]|uniref:Uncharacterized protein n=1 Tax=Klebsiella pneumoniae TaxID=573 RepID=A0A3S4KBB3_KLEPN|nr:Uncharacterised protein [Klebsiella pneumoniae]